ncbi:MAG: SAM-dependent chlorinase/fluorinase [Thermoanaerobacterales bacterium]|nr:SAM-dependent chlorinase/fluorinase [Bacillota bacterium]MDI6906200.1 SAM-dependent chlorinase/fluorinase [Thermoanaerobacterales bacterium]
MIVLLTDFGFSHYVGILKGVIARLAPGCPVIDLAHDIAPQDVRDGAWLLFASYRHFPPGAVFCAVVDPGVGGDRQALVIRTRRYLFVGPDNGLLLPAAEDDGLTSAWALPRSLEACRTFEGRDVFAPAAARLAAGADPASLGRPSEPGTVLRFHRCGREGEVVHIDRFGNVVTNIPPVPGAGAYRLSSGGGTLDLPYHPSYSGGRYGEPMLTTGSADTLEIAVPAGSAWERLRPFFALSVGTRVKLESLGPQERGE